MRTRSNFLGVVAVGALVLLATFVANAAPTTKVEGVGEKITKIVVVDAQFPTSQRLVGHAEQLLGEISKFHQPDSFRVEGTTLVLGVNLEGSDEEIVTATWTSDCPVNSQFELSQSPRIAGKIEPHIRKILVQWTKIRHPHLTGEVERFNVHQEHTRYEVVLRDARRS
jgi:hypothetical protein